MELFKMIALIAFLILSYWTMGYVFYKLGRKIERALSFNLQTRITDLKIENGKLQREIEDQDKRICLLQTTNEEMYDEGKKDVIKSTVKEMIADHDRLDFEKIPEKKNLKGEGGKEDVDNFLGNHSGVHISVDTDVHCTERLRG